MDKRIIAILSIAAVALITASYFTFFNSSSTEPTTSRLQGVILQGAGATFPYPQISEWVRRFQEAYGVEIVYQSVGSGAGQSMFFQQTVDFACSDPPLSRDKWIEHSGSVLQVPWLFGPVVVVYNVPELPVGYNLRLDAVAIAKIYKGEIVYWDDDYIKSLNPEVSGSLPHKEIIVAYRSDSSGTTEIFVTFLYKASEGMWPKELVGKTVNWPVTATGRGVGGKGNEGVTQIVSKTPYSIGYVEWSYAIKNNLRVVAIKNAAGNFVLPTSESLAEAMKNIVLPSSPLDDFSGILHSVIYAPGNKSYPLLGPSHLLIWRYQQDPLKAEALKQFLRWVANEGYNYLVEGYVAPPERVKELLVKAADLIETR